MRPALSMLRRLAPAVLFLLAACSDGPGPVEIKYGRDVCEMCGMIISTPNYAAEIRLAKDNSVHKFDDVGDALNWLDMQGPGLDGAKEIWVMDSEDGKTWLDARHAFYRPGRSPMNYDFAAVPAPGEGAVDFAAMRQDAQKKKHCAPKEEAK